MSVTVSTDVFCDGVEPSGQDCSEWTHGVTGPRVNTVGARQTAKASGWVRSSANGKDYCPACHKRMIGHPTNYAVSNMNHDDGATRMMRLKMGVDE